MQRQSAAQQRRDPATAAIIVGMIGIVITIGIYAPFGPPDTTQAAVLAPTEALVQSGLITTPFTIELPPRGAPPPPALSSVEGPTATLLDTAARLPFPATAYSAPDGAIIGPIEAGRAYRVLARSGTGWAQIDAAGSGAVWVRADSSLDIASSPDLATPIPPPTSPPAPPMRQIISVEATPIPNDPPPSSDPPAPLVPIAGDVAKHAEASGPPSSAGGHPEAHPQIDGHGSVGSRPLAAHDGPPPANAPLQLRSGTILLRTATP